MANFLGNLGAAFQGQQNYQTWETQQEAAKLRIENEKQNLAQIRDLAAEAKAQKKIKAKADEEYYKTLSDLGQPGIPPAPPSAQPPAPGQASVPMVQPQQSAQYGQRPIGPPPPQGPGAVPPMPPGVGQQQGLIPPPPGGGAPMPQGGPPMPQQQGMPPQGPPGPPQGQQMPPQGPPGGPQGQPAGQQPIPPYRTVQGASGATQGPQGQQGQLGIGPPPPQQQQPPRPGSMTLADAAQFIKARGVTDPAVAVQLLDRLQPYLDQQAQQQANQLKQQQLQQDKEAALREKAREADQRSKDSNLSREDRRDAQREANETRKLIGLTMASIAQQNANTKSANAGAGAGGMAPGKDGQLAPGVEAASWDYLIKGTNPPSRGGVYSAVMKNVEKIAKDNNMSVQELTSASADVKTKLAAKRSFEVRAQNMERAENQILAEIPLAEQAIKGLNLSSIPIFQRGGLEALRQSGDPRVTTLDQSLETIFNEFEGIKTGNPGALNVSDVQNARHNIENARTDKQLTAAIAGMRRIMNNAKSALDKTRSDTMKGINDSFKKEPSANVPVLSNQAELAAAIKAGKLKKGDTFNDPSGTAHTVN